MSDEENYEDDYDSPHEEEGQKNTEVDENQTAQEQPATVDDDEAKDDPPADAKPSDDAKPDSDAPPPEEEAVDKEDTPAKQSDAEYSDDAESDKEKPATEEPTSQKQQDPPTKKKEDPTPAPKRDTESANDYSDDDESEKEDEPAKPAPQPEPKKKKAPSKKPKEKRRKRKEDTTGDENLDPEQAEAKILQLNRKANKLSLEGAYVDAKAALDHAKSLLANNFPDDHPRHHQLQATTLNNCGCVFQRAGENAKAVQALEACLELETALSQQSPITMINLSACLNATGRAQDAVDQAKQAVTMTADEAELRSAAWYRVGMGKFQLATDKNPNSLQEDQPPTDSAAEDKPAAVPPAKKKRSTTKNKEEEHQKHSQWIRREHAHQCEEAFGNAMRAAHQANSAHLMHQIQKDYNRCRSYFRKNGLGGHTDPADTTMSNHNNNRSVVALPPIHPASHNPTMTIERARRLYGGHPAHQINHAKNKKFKGDRGDKKKKKKPAAEEPKEEPAPQQEEKPQSKKKDSPKKPTKPASAKPEKQPRKTTTGPRVGTENAVNVLMAKNLSLLTRRYWDKWKRFLRKRRLAGPVKSMCTQLTRMNWDKHMRLRFDTWAAFTKARAPEREKRNAALQEQHANERTDVEAEEQAERAKVADEQASAFAALEDDGKSDHACAKEKEEARIASAEEEKRRADEEAAAAAEAERKKAEEEEAARKKAEEEEAARKKAEEEEAARKKAEAEEAERKRAEEEEAEKKRKAEEEEEERRRKQEEEEAEVARKKQEEEDAEAARKKAQEEKDAAEKQNADDEEAARRQALDDARFDAIDERNNLLDTFLLPLKQRDPILELAPADAPGRRLLVADPSDIGEGEQPSMAPAAVYGDRDRDKAGLTLVQCDDGFLQIQPANDDTVCLTVDPDTGAVSFAPVQARMDPADVDPDPEAPGNPPQAEKPQLWELSIADGDRILLTTPAKPGFVLTGQTGQSGDDALPVKLIPESEASAASEMLVIPQKDADSNDDQKEKQKKDSNAKQTRLDAIKNNLEQDDGSPFCLLPVDDKAKHLTYDSVNEPNLQAVKYGDVLMASFDVQADDNGYATLSLTEAPGFVLAVEPNGHVTIQPEDETSDAQRFMVLDLEGGTFALEPLSRPHHMVEVKLDQPVPSVHVVHEDDSSSFCEFTAKKASEVEAEDNARKEEEDANFAEERQTFEDEEEIARDELDSDEALARAKLEDEQDKGYIAALEAQDKRAQEEYERDLAKLKEEEANAEATTEQEEAAATKIQALQRARQARKEADARRLEKAKADQEKSEKDAAARKIQCAQRQRKARKELEARKAKRAEEKAEQDAAAKKIQGLQRQKLARKEADKRRAAKNEVQADRDKISVAEEPAARKTIDTEEQEEWVNIRAQEAGMRPKRHKVVGTCSQCNEVIAEKDYFSMGDDILLHERCLEPYQEATCPKCSHCGKIIVDDFLEVTIGDVDGVCHQECAEPFKEAHRERCTMCEETLGETFVRVKGKPYHEACADKLPDEAFESDDDENNEKEEGAEGNPAAGENEEGDAANAANEGTEEKEGVDGGAEAEAEGAAADEDAANTNEEEKEEEAGNKPNETEDAAPVAASEEANPEQNAGDEHMNPETAGEAAAQASDETNENEAKAEENDNEAANETETKDEEA